MTRTRQNSKRSTPKEIEDKKAINELESVKTPSSQKHPRKKPNTPFTFAKERIKLLKSSNCIFWKMPFKRLIVEIADDITGNDPEKQLRFQGVAIDALQQAAEDYLLDIFEDANLIASNSGRPTLMTKDLNLARFLQDKQKNKKLRPLTIHEQEFEEHKEKNRIKNEKRKLSKANSTVIKTEEKIKEEKKTTTAKKPAGKKLAPASPDNSSTSGDVVDINTF